MTLLAYFIAFKTIDITVQGLDESKAVIIVSEKNKDISEAIIARLKNIVNGFDEEALITITSVEGTGKKYRKKAIH